MKIDHEGAVENQFSASTVIKKFLSVAKLHIFGESLWSNVASAFNPTIVSVGKSLLPMKLIDGKGINLSDITTIITEQMSHSSVLNSHRSIKSIDKYDSKQVTIDIKGGSSVPGGTNNNRSQSESIVEAISNNIPAEIYDTDNPYNGIDDQFK